MGTYTGNILPPISSSGTKFGRHNVIINRQGHVMVEQRVIGRVIPTK